MPSTPQGASFRADENKQSYPLHAIAIRCGGLERGGGILLIMQARKETQRKNALIRQQRMTLARQRGTHTRQQFLDLVQEFGGRCVRCEKKFPHLDKDHIIPIYQGGSDALSNIQPLCAWCNSAKGPERFNWAEYRRIHGFEQKEVES